MSVGELLSSTPDIGSNRPHRSITVLGDAESPVVTVLARIGLRCLGMLSCSLEAAGRACTVLQVTSENDRHLLQFIDDETSGSLLAENPVHPHTNHSLDTVAAALGRYGGRLKTDLTGLSLPAP
ncbi:MAG: hypothetical protein WBG86_05355 [Polyangiales bacterium]